MRGGHGRGWESKGEQVPREGRLLGEKPEGLWHRDRILGLLPMAGGTPQRLMPPGGLGRQRWAM